MLRKIERSLSSISIYTHGTYWKMNNDWETSHTCGGVATLLVLGIVLAVTLSKLIELFNKETMTLSSNSEISSYFINTTLATSYSDPSFYPVMIGLRPTKFQLTAYYIKPLEDVTQQITMQTCLVSHFQYIPNIQFIYTDAFISSFKCLPLNQKYQVGGNQFKNENSFIAFRLACPPATTCSAEDQVEAVLMYGIPDPYNRTSPVAVIGQTYAFAFPNPGGSSQYVLSFKTNLIETDESIWPLEKKKSQLTVLQLDENFVERTGDSDTLSFMLTTNQKSTRTQRKFMTLLDVLAYLGGIFGTVVGIFFFMSAYGATFFQMMFAAQVFGSKEAKNFGFFRYCKQAAYGIIGSIKKKPDWKEIKQQIELQKAVDHALSLEYLYQRIEFLQKVASVLLEEHHLAVLHLSPRFNKDEHNQNYKDQKLREKVIKYLKKQQLKSSRPEVRDPGLKQELPGGDSSQKILSNNQLSDNLKTHPPREVPEKQAIPMQKRTETEEDIFDEVDIDQESQEEECENSDEEKQEEEKQQKKRQKERAIEDVIYGKFKRLIKQAEQEDGDIRSRMIYQKIDKQMRDCIKRAIASQQQYVEINFQMNKGQ